MKARYFTGLLIILSTSSFGQSYNAQLTKFRENYINDFLQDKNSPQKKDDLQYLRFYDADSTYRVTANAEILDNAPSFTMPVFSGTGRQYAPYALVKFNLHGKPMQLTAYRSLALANVTGYKDYLLLLFTDETNGQTTYGGGRYIDMREGDFKDGKVVIDFNKAYNPYCAFASGYSCPKPPEENRLTYQIKAGEKKYAREH